MSVRAKDNKRSQTTLLASTEAAPFVVHNPDSNHPAVLVCDHASDRFPRTLGSMGLDSVSRQSHLAIDIGARAVTEKLAEQLGVTAIICQYSRLIIDCNRDLMDFDVFLESSDGVVVPGNANLNEDDKYKRATEIYWPYHHAIEAQIDRFKGQGITPIFISIHSFTPVMDGEARRWEMGVLWDKDSVTADIFLKRLSSAGYVVGDNEPYSGKGPRNFTIHYHAERNLLRHVSIEMRQDLIRHENGIISMADVLCKVINSTAELDG